MLRYLKAYDEIRRLYADQQGHTDGVHPSLLSFNAEGGRCEECKGEGVINIEMQFMADITIPCEAQATEKIQTGYTRYPIPRKEYL